MAQLFYGSICFSDLIEKVKEKHSAFTKANNGKIYINVSVWLNDEVDKYGNIMSILLNSKKEMKEKEEKFYIGNCKISEQKPITELEVKTLVEGIDDLPF
jgi:hypothetical protein